MDKADKLEEIRIKLESLGKEDATREGETSTLKSTIDKLLLKMLLKTAEEEKKLEKAEIMKLEEEFEVKDFNWNECKKAFRKYIVDNEFKTEVNDTKYLNRSNKQYRRSSNSSYRGKSDWNRGRSRSKEYNRSSTPNFRNRSRSRDHDSISVR